MAVAVGSKRRHSPSNDTQLECSIFVYVVALVQILNVILVAEIGLFASHMHIGNRYSSNVII